MDHDRDYRDLFDGNPFGEFRSSPEGRPLDARGAMEALAASEARRLEALRRLAGGVAHELNNQLAVILADASLLADRLVPGDAEAASCLEAIEGAARRAAATIRKLLAFSRQELLQPRPVDLGATLGALIPRLERLIPGAVRVVLGAGTPGPVLALADPRAVEEMVMTLARNAADAMPDGGTLTLAAWVAKGGKRGAGRSAGGGEQALVGFSVSDTGVGMDEATRGHLFEPFFTTKHPGVGSHGLGLATVHGLAQQQGGGVLVESELGRGTTVQVYLARALAAERAAGVATGAAPVGSARTVLLVEDEAALRRAAARILERHGFRVLTAEDGEDALAVFASHEAEVGLIVSDVVMPRMGGLELHRALRRAGKQVPFLLASGYAADDVLRRTQEAALPIVEKPWTAEDFVRRVGDLLGGGAGN